MIRPNKYTKLDACTIRVSAVLVKQLREKQICSFNELHEFVARGLSDDALVEFIPALNFLFLLGKIKYYPSKDMVEFIQG